MCSENRENPGNVIDEEESYWKSKRELNFGDIGTGSTVERNKTRRKEMEKGRISEYEDEVSKEQENWHLESN